MDTYRHQPKIFCLVDCSKRAQGWLPCAFAFCGRFFFYLFSIYKNMKQERIITYLSKELKYVEFMQCGIKCEIQTIEDNEDNGFEFEECVQVFIEGFGNCYKFFDHYYVCEGFQWYRFMMADLILISN